MNSWMTSSRVFPAATRAVIFCRISTALSHVHSPTRLRPQVPHMQMMAVCSSCSTFDLGAIMTVFADTTCCACSSDEPSVSATSMTSVVVVAALDGTLLVANAKDRSGSSAITLPNTTMPMPNQIQLTSGLTMILSTTVCDATS